MLHIVHLEDVLRIDSKMSHIIIIKSSFVSWKLDHMILYLWLKQCPSNAFL